MLFDGKPASRITGSEIIEMVNKRVREDARLDFKRECYKKTPGDTKEMLKDVTSFANTDGGYILIGIEDVDSCASGIARVADANEEAQSLRDQCLQCISPRIRDLEIVVLEQVEPGKDIVVIGIPESMRRPHMVTYGANTYFCRRYQDGKRSMSVGEIGEAFQEQLAATQFGLPRNLAQQLEELLALQRANRLAQVQASDSTLDAIGPEEVRRIMEARFRNQIANEPYFRAVSTPVDTETLSIDPGSGDLRALLTDPPATRAHGWTLPGVKKIKSTSEGCIGDGYDGSRLVFLKNGHLEFTIPYMSTLFQFALQGKTGAAPELFPLAVCELTVNFARLAKAVYEMVGSGGDVLFQLEFANIEGFFLRPGAPDTRIYLMPIPLVDLQPYQDKDLITNVQRVKAGFDPDPLALSLVEQVYNAFEIPRKYLPFFTRDGKFDVSSNSVESG